MNEQLDQHMRDAWKALTDPGAEYEVTRGKSCGRDVLTYVRGPRNLAELWSTSAEWGTREYIIFGDERLTYEDADFSIRAIQAWFAKQGVTQGDRVAIAMRNYPEWLLIYWAAVSVGIVVVGMNAWWVTTEVAYALNDCKPKVVFCDEERLARLPGLTELSWPIMVVAIRASAPGVVGWDEVCRTTGSIDKPTISPDDDACIFYTSGTTGMPKGAQLTHLGCTTSLMNQRFSGDVHNLAAVLAFGSEATANSPSVPIALATTPLFHVTANNTLAHPITLGGGKLVLMYKWDVDEAIRLAAREQITHLNGVPLIVREFVTRLEATGQELPSLYVMGAGGAPFGPDLADRIAHLDSRAVAAAGYGLTEVGGTICVNLREFLAERPESCGRPLPAFETRLIDTKVDDRGRLVGELCVKGGSVIKGYLDRPDATDETIINGWLHTGDVAHIDGAGYLFIVDRKKDMVLRGGENVYCAEVEAALYRHPAVAEACVFGVSDDRLGEAVAAAVTLQTGAQLTTAELQATASTYLAAYKVPQHIWLLDSPLPRNASGKILRRNLRESLGESYRRAS